MNIDFNEQGKVEIDEIMQIHQQKMNRRADADTSTHDSISNDEPTISSTNKGTKHVHSHECVGSKYKKNNQLKLRDFYPFCFLSFTIYFTWLVFTN